MPLFNGTDLTGWTGGAKGYLVRDGLLIVDPSQGRRRQSVHGAGVRRLHLPVRVSPDARRQQRRGDSSPPGRATRRIRAWRFRSSTTTRRDTGAGCTTTSVTGRSTAWSPPRRATSSRVGEWNYEEITAKGKQITVKLNGDDDRGRRYREGQHAQDPRRPRSTPA